MIKVSAAGEGFDLGVEPALVPGRLVLRHDALGHHFVDNGLGLGEGRL